ncbi:hypothetical protein V6N11_022425 [Hibiscus sabdariffa]|uniref:Uncharacterized protein n=1 Tax=Hibiscus sabdariffa TaxID=183260 RepID=A0ABR2TJ43_9ROSI
MGGALIDQTSAKWYLDFLDITNLLEIPMKGGMFTWSNKRSGEDVILEKLDRALATVEWCALFDRAIALVEAAIASDHCPIVLCTDGLSRRSKREFKFDSKWITEEECYNVVKEGWVSNTQRSNDKLFVEEAVELTELKKELLNLWEMEERKRNNICRLKNEAGVWIEEEEEIVRHLQEHYQKVKASCTALEFSSMALISWNVRGLGNKDTIRALENLTFKYRLTVVFLSETKQKRRFLEKNRMKMKLSNAFYVDPDGAAGELAL